MAIKRNLKKRKSYTQTVRGLEPAIPRSKVWCLIHLATRSSCYDRVNNRKPNSRVRYSSIVSIFFQLIFGPKMQNTSIFGPLRITTILFTCYGEPMALWQYILTSFTNCSIHWWVWNRQKGTYKNVYTCSSPPWRQSYHIMVVWLIRWSHLKDLPTDGWSGTTACSIDYAWISKLCVEACHLPNGNISHLDHAQPPIVIILS